MNRKSKALEFVDLGYDIKVTGRHVQITDSMKDYVMEKISKIERFTNRIIDVNVIMDIQKLDHFVELILKTGNLKIVSHGVSTDMYASIDKAVDKLENQLRRYKSKIQDYHLRNPKESEVNVNVLSRPTEEDWEAYESDSVTSPFRIHEIVKKETCPLKMLTQAEAAVKMELSGDNFLVYKSEEDQKLKIIYKRSDGNFGIIEPQC